MAALPPDPDSAGRPAGGTAAALPAWPLWLALALVAVLALVAWQKVLSTHHDTVGERLDSVGRLRQVQVKEWLASRLSEARFLAGSPLWGAMFVRANPPQEAGQPDGPSRVLQRAASYAQATGYGGAMVFDANGRLLAAEPAVAAPPDPALTQAVQRALAEGQVLTSGPHAGPDGAPSAVLHIVMPLLATGRPARGAVVLQAPLDRMLAPSLRDWTAAGAAGVTLLWVPQGERWLGLEPGPLYGHPTNHELTAAGRQRPLPQVLAGAAAASGMLEVDGPRGEASYAAVYPVDGTGWWIEVAVAQAGADRPLWRTGVGLGFVAVLMALALLLLTRYWRQQQQLGQARLQSQAQQQRLRSLALLEAVADNSTDAIFAKDAQGRYLLFNRAASRMMGRDEAQVLNHGDEVLMPQAEAERVRANDQMVLQQDRVSSFEEMLTTTGGTRTFLATKGPLRDRTGQLLGIFGISRDVSEQVQLRAEVQQQRDRLEHQVAERTQELQDSNHALREAENLVRNVGDLLPGRLVYWDSEERCRYANRAWFVWYDETPDSVLGRRASELTLPHGDAGRAALRAAALRGEQVVAERIEVLPDGRETHQRVMFMPDKRGDTVVGVTVMSIDITEEKAVLNALERARDQAEAATQAKSAFLANMSHEIRTPLNAVIGLADLLQRDIQDPTQRGRIGRLTGAARHLLRVINDVLDLSKIEAGKLSLEEVVFSVEALMVRAMELVGDGARAKGLELVLDTDHLPPRLLGDPTRLLQALLNLLSNAVKFTEQGWVRLRGEVQQEAEGRLLVRFEVRDSGVGIAAADQARLFEPFEQVDPDTQRRLGGTGLGLAMIRHLARLMGGDVGVQSVPGEGSCFWFSVWLSRAPEHLPTPEAAQQVAAGLAADPALQRLQVLLVDDLEPSRMVLGERLRVLGLQVQACASGDEALAWLAQCRSDGQALPDLLMLDWQMPGRDGLETLQALQALLGDALPPSVLITAHDGQALAQRALAAGFAAVLPKPISPSSLHDLVLQVLRPGLSAPLPLTLSALGTSDPATVGRLEARLRAEHFGQSVLLVDDNPVNREVARAMLERVGLVVREAEDGEAAVAEVGHERPELVLMDLQMPRMDGFEATRAIRALHGASPPVLAMTAHAFGEDRAACLAAGMLDHVPKPVDALVLYTALLRWLPEQRAPWPLPAAADTLALDPAQAGAVQAPRTSPPPSPPLSVPHAVPITPGFEGLAEQLARTPGLDLDGLLARLGGQWPLARKVIESFVQQYRGGLPAAQTTLPTAQALAQTAHALQGAAATLGATVLADTARRLEAQARSGAPEAALRDGTAQLARMLQSLVGALADALAAQALDGP